MSVPQSRATPNPSFGWSKASRESPSSSTAFRRDCQPTPRLRLKGRRHSSNQLRTTITSVRAARSWGRVGQVARHGRSGMASSASVEGAAKQSSGCGVFGGRGARGVAAARQRGFTSVDVWRSDALISNDVDQSAACSAKIGPPVASPGEHRTPSPWQRDGGVTDFPAEQSPEVEARPKADDVATRRSARSRQRREGRDDGDIGTAAGEGKASKGRAPSGKAGVQASVGNTANPMAGSGVQQTRTVHRGVNRRSRERRQGRNVCRAWQLDVEGQTSV